CDCRLDSPAAIGDRVPSDNFQVSDGSGTKGLHAVNTATLAAQISKAATAADAEHPFIRHFGLLGAGYSQYQGCVLIPILSASGEPISFVQIYRNGRLRLLGGDQVHWEHTA